ncbi:hypothetical protein C2W59_03808 [Bacillus pumilus]|uniref:Uncharacterized protein n=1 Tax=Bacillus pumilus TaxID=1408 RepID=A0AB34QTL3_BACPU|nr:hypothetical protein B4127_0987 [Bacillus pumilus]RAP20980.1 hypothetical protein C2W59_03808 [Bacillus pumilus]
MLQLPDLSSGLIISNALPFFLLYYMDERRAVCNGEADC